jgi:hypothetical protein
MKTKEDFINEIKPNKANLNYISETGEINGNLFADIKNAMQKYADQQLSIDRVVGQSEQLPKDVTDEDWETLRGKGLDTKLKKW